MPTYIALLRAVNVGGRVVKMEELRRLFEEMEFANVRTFIASGNVIFDASQRSGGRLEPAIEKALERALKYPVATFVRSIPELASLVEHPLFAGNAVRNGTSLYVAFTREEPARDAARKLLSFNTDAEEFQIYKNHVLWVMRRPFHESKFSGALLERTIGMPATVRNSTTVKKMMQKFG